MITRHGSLRRGRWWALGAVLLAMLLAAAACGGGEEPTATPRTGAPPTATVARVAPTPTPTIPPVAAGVETFTWNFTTSSPGARAREIAHNLADRLEAASGGRLTIRRHEAGSIVPGYQEIHGIRSGALDIATTWLGGYPAYLGIGAFFLGSSAGVLGPWGSMSWGTKPEVLEAVRGLVPGVLVFQNGMGTVENWALCHEGIVIQEPEDFRGLRYRAGGYYAEVITQLGGAGQDIAQTELFGALERGVLDCAEVGNPSGNYDRFFYEIAPEWHTPGQHQQGYASFGIVVSEESWNELPADLQLALAGAMKGYAWDNGWKSVRDDVKIWAILTNPADPLIRYHPLPKHTQQWIRDTSHRFFNDEVKKKGNEMAAILWNSQQDYDLIWNEHWNSLALFDYEATYPVTSKPAPPQ